jgi:hypothetical protein
MNNKNDEYAGLSPTWAAACRKADAQAKPRLELEDIPLVSGHGVPSAAALQQRQYEAALERQRKRYGLPKSTLDAATYLMQQCDPDRVGIAGAAKGAVRLEQWLMRHSPEEIDAIETFIRDKQKVPQS